ncbi:hypothetical protein EC973_004041 [Apophysomyces ossiformis]|uniref:Uncharacterized protein n=1 Tax=Apophysomyces ossiformis TaxID=679940 RepID=A0A8H7BZU7_9FUNG|nr:hypothetical protein EC973_004041 [Apophysomyces ossiformis]
MLTSKCLRNSTTLLQTTSPSDVYGFALFLLTGIIKSYPRGVPTIELMVNTLENYDRSIIHSMLRRVQIKLHLLLVAKRLRIVIALDAAQVPLNGILSDKLISSAALIRDRAIMFNDKNQIRSHFFCGFLTPLSGTMSNMRAMLVFDGGDVKRMLSDLLDWLDCNISPDKLRELSEGALFSIGIVKRLVATGSTQYYKQKVLESAVDVTINDVKKRLHRSICAILESDRTGVAARLLSRMVSAYRLQGGRISLSNKQQSNFVNGAVCRPRLHDDGIHLIMDEPIVFETVQEELTSSAQES